MKPPASRGTGSPEAAPSEQSDAQGASEQGNEAPPAGPARVPWYRWPSTTVRRLYDWTLSWAETRYAVPALALLAFMEASVFPIPPDVLLMAMCLGKPKRSLHYAAVCTAGSVVGGLLGLYIGMSLWHTLGISDVCPEFGGGALLFDYVPSFTCDNFAKVQSAYQDNAWMALFTAAFTPIPYKVFTIAAGVFQVAVPTLVGASILGRGARFFAVAALIYFFGPKVRVFIEKRFELLTVVFTALLIGGFALVKYVI